MAEWLLESGIGETRAALIVDDRIVTALIEADDDGPRAGTIAPARLTKIVIPGRRAIATLDDGADMLIEPVPAGVTQGARFMAEIRRAALPEPGRAKLAIAKVAPADAIPAPGPDLAARIAATGHSVRTLPIFGPDALEAAGWSELMEEAMTGQCDFDGGSLRLSLTPAMTLIDVDGWLPLADLLIAGAAAAARMILRHDIGGSIGVDLPTVESKAARLSAAQAIDAILPQPFERTAVNGFGFLQIVRRRTRASFPERLQGDPAGCAARALLRRAERTPGAGPRTISAAPSVIERIAARADWQAELARRIGASIALRPVPGIAISAGHVDAQNP